MSNQVSYPDPRENKKTREGYQNDFYKYLVDGQVFKSEAAAKVMLSMLTRAMLAYLVEKREPLDLGFCIIHPTLFRPSWKGHASDSSGTGLTRLQRDGSPRLLSHTKYLMWDKALKIFKWRLEIEETPQWERWSSKYEKFYKRKNYLIKRMDTVRSSVLRHWRLLKIYVRQSTRPYLQFPTSVFRYRATNLPQEKLVRPNGISHRAPGGISGDRWHHQKEEPVVLGEDECVPEVRKFQSSPANVRDAKL